MSTANRSCANASSCASTTRLERTERVVGEHRGNRDGEAERGHDERLADGAGDLVERALPAHADRDQRVIDAPHRAEQADERRGAADRGEHGQPDSKRAVSSSITRRIARVRNSAARARFVELVGAVLLMVARSDDGVPGEMRERLVGMLFLEMRRDRFERRRIPERIQEARRAPLENRAPAATSRRSGTT